MRLRDVLLLLHPLQHNVVDMQISTVNQQATASNETADHLLSAGLAMSC